MEQRFGRASSRMLAGRTAWVPVMALAMLCALSQRTLAQGAIAGQVRYYSNDAAVPGVVVNFTGIAQTSMITDDDGLYAFTDPGTGSCSIEPSKTGGLENAISALDATWALQAVVGNRTFNATQLLACDVTGDGTLSALDAARILQLIAGVRSRFPVAEACGSDWLFVPVPAPAPDQQVVMPQMSPVCSPGAIVFQSMLTPVEAQDFLAAAFGDCTGNWQVATPPPATSTPVNAQTPTRTAAAPATATAPPTATATPVVPASATATHSRTATVTHSRTATATHSHSATATRSLTATATRTGTSTRTLPPTIAPTPTLPPVATATRTRTATATAPATSTITATSTRTPPSTATHTRSATPSGTTTFSRSATASLTPSATATQTRTFSATRTLTPTRTATLSPTRTNTITRTPTRTGTRTATPTSTFTPSPSPTATCPGGLAWGVSAPVPISSQAGGILWLAKTVPTNAGWGIFWLRQDPGATNFARLYYAHVGFSGQITVAPLLVTSIPRIAFRGHYYFVAWNQDHYGLLIANQATLYYYNLSIDGVLSGQRAVGPPLFFNSQFDQESAGDIDAHPDGFLGVVEGDCGGHSCSYAFKLDRNGAPVGSPINLVDFDFTHQFYPRSAFDGSGFAIISVKDITISNGGVMTKYLPLTGTISTHAKVVPSKEYLWDEFPDLAWNGDHFASVWTENSARSDTAPWQIHFASFRRTKPSSTLIAERVIDMVAQKTNHRWTTQVHAVGAGWLAQYATRAANNSIIAVYEMLGSNAQTIAALEPFTLSADALGSSPHFAAGQVGKLGIARGANLAQGTEVTFYTLPPPACAP